MIDSRYDRRRIGGDRLRRRRSCSCERKKCCACVSALPAGQLALSLILLATALSPASGFLTHGAATSRGACRWRSSSTARAWQGRDAGVIVAFPPRPSRLRMVATEGSIPALSMPPSPSSDDVPSSPERSAAGGVGEAGAVEASVARGVDGQQEQRAGSSSQQRLRVAMFFFFWYAFNVGYNLSTKCTLTAMPLPMTLAAVQLLVGVPYVWALWLAGLRKAPAFSLAKLRQATPVAVAHTMAHLAAVVSIGAGAVGFVQVVKGAEPLFTSGLSFLAGSPMPWPVYLTLLPVIGGVAMASAGEISFSILAFGAAMTSNASAASRSVLGKMYMAKEKENGGTMDAGNLYAVMTMLGCLVLTPLAVAMEGPKVAGVWDAALSAGNSPHGLVKNGLLSGLFFYLYNEVSFYALNIIHPVTHALGNTLKRVVMIAVSVLVLNHKFTPLGLVGCCTAIGGVMAYSITKAKLENGAAAASAVAGDPAVKSVVPSAPAGGE